jgi:signal transduction histidine kinase
MNLKVEGQGLGLAIAHTIAHFHHIEIAVTSEPDSGSTFSLLFIYRQKAK